jgi:hypothetical protein
MLTEPPDADQLPDETVLPPIGGGLSQAPYRRGIIGKRDPTLEPMIPPTSIVHIDTQKRSVSLRKHWKHEFQRDTFVAGANWIKKSEWLTLVHGSPVAGGSTGQK